jgi:DNA-binding response OmpR family regulator
MAVILLVDDDDQFRDMVKAMLERQGHEVDTAGNGIDAMKRYRARPPDLVITDLIMPDKDGLETIRELRRASPGIRIVAMSGGGRSSPTTYLKMASDMGAVVVLPKPFSNQQLSEAVRTALSSAEEAP